MLQRVTIVCKNVDAPFKPTQENRISFNFFLSSTSFFPRKSLAKFCLKIRFYDLSKNIPFIQLFLVEWFGSPINEINNLKYFKGIQQSVKMSMHLLNPPKKIVFHSTSLCHQLHFSQGNEQLNFVSKSDFMTPQKIFLSSNHPSQNGLFLQ